jgi:putative transposase
MAWKQVKVEDQRKKFIIAVNEGSNFSDICHKFGISRPTGYKWLRRYEEEGLDGLYDRSKAPHSHQNTIEEYLQNKVLEIKCKFPKLGPKKIYAKLKEFDSNTCWPCPSSIGNIFDRNGLTIRRKLRKRVAANVPNAFNGTESNDVWCMDFKGTLRTVNNEDCDPFTLTDSSSRFLIKCQILERNNFKHVWATLDTAFREFGLPQHILSDNGPPFATVGLGRLSRLSINLIKAGVKPTWITPGKPQQNGRHERMHGTMEFELGKPAANSRAELKTKLLIFQKYYNHERPHEALGQLTPGQVYQPSKRNWNGRFQSPEYSNECQVRKVQKDGTINLKGQRIFIGETFHQEPVGLLEVDNELRVYYGEIFLGIINDNFKVEFQRI